jgi:hypothetical protein
MRLPVSSTGAARLITEAASWPAVSHCRATAAPLWLLLVLLVAVVPFNRASRHSSISIFCNTAAEQHTQRPRHTAKTGETNESKQTYIALHASRLVEEQAVPLPATSCAAASRQSVGHHLQRRQPSLVLFLPLTLQTNSVTWSELRPSEIVGVLAYTRYDSGAAAPADSCILFLGGTQ